MLYSTTSRLCGYFWIGFYEDKESFDILFRDVLIHRKVSAFSVFEEKILAIKRYDTVFVYLINPLASNAEDATTLIRSESEHGNCELIRFYLNDYLYTVDFKCKITCCGKH